MRFTNKRLVNATFALLVMLLTLVSDVKSSRGDASFVHKKCMDACTRSGCTRTVLEKESQYSESVSPALLLFLWDCSSECDYTCMWTTVAAFQADKQPVPQFHGKWPFIRWFTIQEPASTLFSIFNALAQITGILWFRSRVYSSTPLFYTWHVYFLVALNAWVWSTVFHMRDYPFTEKMDYLGATSLVIFQLYTLLARLLVKKPRHYTALTGVLSALMYGYHIYRLGFIHFDYGYHVKSAVFVGTLNALGWVCWCAASYSQQRYVWSCAATMVSLMCLVLLEVLDFPPYRWILDAHSLWHLGTAPLTLLWYRFLIDDGLHMHEQLESNKKGV